MSNIILLIHRYARCSLYLFCQLLELCVLIRTSILSIYISSFIKLIFIFKFNQTFMLVSIIMEICTGVDNVKIIMFLFIRWSHIVLPSTFPARGSNVELMMTASLPYTFAWIVKKRKYVNCMFSRVYYNENCDHYIHQGSKLFSRYAHSCPQQRFCSFLSMKWH